MLYILFQQKFPFPYCSHTLPFSPFLHLLFIHLLTPLGVTFFLLVGIFMNHKDKQPQNVQVSCIIYCNIALLSEDLVFESFVHFGSDPCLGQLTDLWSNCTLSRYEVMYGRQGTSCCHPEKSCIEKDWNYKSTKRWRGKMTSTTSNTSSSMLVETFSIFVPNIEMGKFRQIVTCSHICPWEWYVLLFFLLWKFAFFVCFMGILRHISA